MQKSEKTLRFLEDRTFIFQQIPCMYDKIRPVLLNKHITYIVNQQTNSNQAISCE